MPFYEYKVVPAPAKAPKVRGLKGPARFASGLETLMNELAQDGWEYLRAEALQEVESRGFLAGSQEVTRTVLVFRRELVFEDAAADPQPQAPEAPRDHWVVPEPEAPSEGSWQDAAEADAPPAMPEPVEPVRSEPAELPRFSRRPLTAERRDGGPDS